MRATSMKGRARSAPLRRPTIQTRHVHRLLFERQVAVGHPARPAHPPPPLAMSLEHPAVAAPPRQGRVMSRQRHQGRSALVATAGQHRVGHSAVRCRSGERFSDMIWGLFDRRAEPRSEGVVGEHRMAADVTCPSHRGSGTRNRPGQNAGIDGKQHRVSTGASLRLRATSWRNSRA